MSERAPKLPWSIPHDIEGYLPSVADKETNAALVAVQLIRALDRDPGNETGFIGRTDKFDFTYRRLMHSFENALLAYYDALDRGDDERAEPLGHALYLAEGLSLLLLKLELTLDGATDGADWWKYQKPDDEDSEE